MKLSFQCRHALPDCLYLAAAKRLDVELLTSDRVLHQRAAKAKTEPNRKGRAQSKGTGAFAHQNSPRERPVPK